MDGNGDWSRDLPQKGPPLSTHFTFNSLTKAATSEKKSCLSVFIEGAFGHKNKIEYEKFQYWLEEELTINLSYNSYVSKGFGNSLK